MREGLFTLIKPKFSTKFLTVIAAAAVAVAPSLVAQPASAVSAFSLTVVASGGAAENSGWTYSNGQITSTANVSINASDVVAKLALGSLAIDASRILVNASINNTTANDLTLMAAGNIIVGGGLTLQSQGGDIIFNSDSDGNSTGHVRLGWDATCTMGNILTHGGNIIIGGGANPLTTTTAAQSSDPAATGCPGGTPPLSGVGIYNYTLDAAGGDISVRGGSPNLGGSVSVRGINIAGSGGLTPTFQTTGSGNISLYGDGSLIGHNNAWGIAFGNINVTTGSGSITLEGRGNPSGPTNARGMSLGGTTALTSTSGNISILDRTNGAQAGYTGINMSGAVTASTSGTFTVQADEISQSGALTISAASASIGPNTTTSFTATYVTGVINAANTQSLSIGAAGNSSAVTLGSAITSGGPIAVYGSTITVNAPVTATNAPITFTASTGVTQNAMITASALDLRGTATYNPQSFTVTGGTAQVAYYASFDPQGGSAVGTVTFASGGSLTLPAAPTRSGYVFNGWFLASTGGTALASPFTPGVTADILLYAQWSAAPVQAPSIQWQAPSSAAPYPQLTGVQTAKAVVGSPVTIKLSGYNLNLASEVTASSGTVRVISKTASSMEVEITGADLGRGSITFKNAERSLRLESAFQIVESKPAVPAVVETRSFKSLFASGSSKLASNVEASLAPALANADSSKVFVVTGSVVAANPTKADERLGLARAKALGALIKKLIPGANISYAVSVADKNAPGNRFAQVVFTLLANK